MDNTNMQLSAKDISEMAKTAKEVLPETISETDGAISTIVGWFNNVVLFPVKKANITYKYKLDCFEIDLRRKVEQIPPDQVCEPKLSIAGPTLESLKYTFDEQELREMYVNLLASSMNKEKSKIAHPSFVEIIRQMDVLDAILFKYLSKMPGNICAINPRIDIVGKGQHILGATPEWFFGVSVTGYDFFQVSASLIRLGKLGIIELLFDRELQNHSKTFDILIQTPELQAMLQKEQQKRPEASLALSKTNSVFYVNEYGRQFSDCCIEH